MKILCQTNLINKALQSIKKALNVKVQNSLLSGIYIKTLDDSIEMKASDMEFSAIIKIPVRVIEHGEILVSGDFFTNVLKGTRSEEVEIYTKDTDRLLYIESNASEYSLLTMPVNEYPNIEKIQKDQPALVLKGNILKDLISKTAFACAKDNSKPIFRCIYLNIKDSVLNCVATDSHRLAIKKYNLSESIQDINLLIPNEFLIEVANHLDDENDVELYVSSGKIAVQINNLYMQTSIMEGVFPDYNKIIPTEFNIKVSFNINEMIAAVENASKFAKDKKYINCQINKDEFIIMVNNPDLGKAKEVIGCNNSGMDINITFNAEYIVQVLKKIESEKANLFINSSTAPCSIKQDKDDSYNYIVSPMRVNN